MLQKKYKKTKMLYSRKYRAEGRDKDYERSPKRREATQNRVEARRIAEKKFGKEAIKGKDIHHKDSNPTNNSESNLAIKKRYHEGGVKGNNNAAGKHRKSK